MVSRGRLNSRLKDYFDVLVLARTFSFDAKVLWGAISSAFEARETPISTEVPVGLTPGFAEAARQLQWRAFAEKNLSKEMAKLELPEVIEGIHDFLWPLHQQALNGKVSGSWSPMGPWLFAGES